jgi:beta-lactam-binding protein with PASTA domain
MGFFRFTFSKVFIINVAIAIVLAIVAVFYTQFRLGSFTLHGEEIGVPDFRGYQVENIGEILERKKLRMTIVDSLYDSQLDAGAIVQQDPAPGSMVKENRRIYFTINSFSPPIVKLPSLIDQSKRQAMATLEILELIADTIRYKVSPYDGLVLDVLYKGQSVAEGADIPLGSHLRLIIGENNDLPRVEMPDLTGLNLHQVDSALSAYSLKMGLLIDCVECESKADSLDATVFRTYPQYKMNKRVRMWSTVDIWLTKMNNDTIQ